MYTAEKKMLFVDMRLTKNVNVIIISDKTNFVINNDSWQFKRIINYELWPFEHTYYILYDLCASYGDSKIDKTLNNIGQTKMIYYNHK